MPHEPIICRWCGLRVPDAGECRRAARWLVFALVYAADEEELSFCKWQIESHKASLCHCPEHPWTVFSSTPQPEDLEWHDKHDR